MHPPHGAPIPDRGDRGHRLARPPSGGRQRAGGEANGQSIPVERKVARGRGKPGPPLFATGDAKWPRHPTKAARPLVGRRRLPALWLHEFGELAVGLVAMPDRIEGGRTRHFAPGHSCQLFCRK